MPRKEIDEWLCRELHARLDEIAALIANVENPETLQWLIWNIDLEIVCRYRRMSEDDPRALLFALERRMPRRAKLAEYWSQCSEAPR